MNDYQLDQYELDALSEAFGLMGYERSMAELRDAVSYEDEAVLSA